MINENAIKEKYLRGNKTKLTLAKIATAAMIVTALMFSQHFLSDININTAAQTHVYDSDGILSDATINAINGRVSAGPEIVVAVEREHSRNRDLFKRAERLFNDYKVNDNGILFIISVPENTSSRNAVEKWVEKNIVERFSGKKYSHAYFLGRNIDYSFRSEIDNIFGDDFRDSYAAGDYNAAALAAYDAFLEYFGYQYMSEIRENQAVPGSSSPSFARGVRFSLGVAAVLGAALILAGMFTGGGKNKAARKVYKRSSWFG
jgi:hypothetical protein